MADNRKKDGKAFDVGGWSARSILIVSSLLYMVNYMDRQVLSAVLEPMKIDLGLTDAQAGVLQTVFFLSMAVLAFPVSYMVDRWSRRKAVALMAVMWSAFTYITGLGRSFLGVLIPRIFVGVGEAGFSAGGTAWITAAYPKESRGKALGVFNVSIPLGAALGVMLGGYLSTHHGGWRTPFFIFAIPGIVLGIAAFFLKDYKTVTEKSSASSRGLFGDALTLWRIPSLKWLFIGYGMHNLMSFAILVWMPAALMRTLDITESKAGMIMGAIVMCAIIGAVLGGFLADSWQKRNSRGRMLLPSITDPLAALMVILSMLALRAGGMFGLFFAFAVVYGILNVTGLPALGAVTQDVVHPRLKSMSWGLAMFCMYMFGGGWAPVMVGALSDALGGGAGGLQVALVIASTSGFLAGLCFWVSSRYYPADMEKVKGYQLEAEK